MKCYSLLLTLLFFSIAHQSVKGQCTAPFGNPINTSVINGSIGNKASQSFTVPMVDCMNGRFSQLTIQTATNNSEVTLLICPGKFGDSGFGTNCYEQTGISWQVSEPTTNTIELDATDPKLAYEPGDVFTFTFTSDTPLNLGRNEIDPMVMPTPPNPYPDGAYYNESDQLQANVDLAFTIATLAPLPVTWSGFTAQPTARGNLLEWRTSAESDNYGFFVERSSDGREWREIAFVAASATGAAGDNYTYLDAEARSGATWYRLRQQDYDGTTDYSPIVRLRGMKTAPVRIYPNPVRAGRAIYLDTATKVTTVELYSLDGRRYWSATPTDTHSPLPLPADLAPGVYVLRVQGDAGVSTQRLVIR
jgi:hypothetical protein